MTQVQPLILVHAWSNSEYGLLLLLLLRMLVGVHHKRAIRLGEGWRLADPRLVPMLGLIGHHWFELAGGALREVESLTDPRVLEHYQRSLSCQLNLPGAWLALQWDNVNSFLWNASKKLLTEVVFQWVLRPEADI